MWLVMDYWFSLWWEAVGLHESSTSEEGSASEVSTATFDISCVSVCDGVWNWLEKFHSNSHVIIFALSMCQTRCGYQVPTFQNAKKWWVSSPVRKKQKMKVLLGCTLKNMMIIWLYIWYYDALLLQQGKRSSAAFFFWDLSGDGRVKEICRL